MARLIKAGHPPESVWSYTPRQIKAWSFIELMLERQSKADLLALHTMAARGDPKEVKAKLKELGRD